VRDAGWVFFFVSIGCMGERTGGSGEKEGGRGRMRERCGRLASAPRCREGGEGGDTFLPSRLGWWSFLPSCILYRGREGSPDLTLVCLFFPFLFCLVSANGEGSWDRQIEEGVFVFVD